MTPFDTYTKYLAFKNHFTKEKYEEYIAAWKEKMVSQGEDPEKLPTPTVDKAKMNYTKMMKEKRYY